VEELRSLVHDTIHNAFKKPTLPTVSEYHNYNFSNIYDILMGIWNSKITGDEDDLATIQNKTANYLVDTKKFYFDESGDVLRLKGILICEGDGKYKLDIKRSLCRTQH
jgi:hypothetical protein